MENDCARILVCDDESGVREMLQEYLTKRGYLVTMASNSEELRGVLSSSKIDLIILDINMPGEDGLTTLRSLRPEIQTPVILLTAAGEVVDRIIGLEMGADDYLGKPVDLRELEARIKAVLRRLDSVKPQKPETTKTNTAMFGDFVLDIESTKLSGPDGTDVPLTAMEFRLLKARQLRKTFKRTQPLPTTQISSLHVNLVLSILCDTQYSDEKFSLHLFSDMPKLRFLESGMVSIVSFSGQYSADTFPCFLVISLYILRKQNDNKIFARAYGARNMHSIFPSN